MKSEKESGQNEGQRAVVEKYVKGAIVPFRVGGGGAGPPAAARSSMNLHDIGMVGLNLTATSNGTCPKEFFCCAASGYAERMSVTTVLAGSPLLSGKLRWLPAAR